MIKVKEVIITHQYIDISLIHYYFSRLEDIFCLKLTSILFQTLPKYFLSNFKRCLISINECICVPRILFLTLTYFLPELGPLAVHFQFRVFPPYGEFCFLNSSPIHCGYHSQKRRKGGVSDPPSRHSYLIL